MQWAFLVYHLLLLNCCMICWERISEQQQCSVFDGKNRVKVVFDSEIASHEWYGCSDRTTIDYLKLRAMDVVRFLDYMLHTPYCNQFIGLL